MGSGGDGGEPNGKGSLASGLLGLFGVGHQVMGQAHLVAIGGAGVAQADGFWGRFAFFPLVFFLHVFFLLFSVVYRPGWLALARRGKSFFVSRQVAKGAKS